MQKQLEMTTQAGLENLLRCNLMHVVEYLELPLGPIFWKGLMLCKLLILKGIFIAFINYVLLERTHGF